MSVWRLNHHRETRTITALICLSTSFSPVSQVQPEASSSARDMPPLEIIATLDGKVGAIADHGPYLYFGLGPRMVVSDITTPGNPRIVGRSELLAGEVTAIVVADELAVAATAAHSLHVLDIREPSRPRIESSIELVVGARVDQYDATSTLILQGPTLLVGHDDLGLLAFDLSTPDGPRLLARYDPEDPNNFAVLDMALTQDLVLAATRNNGLHVVDLSDPERPERVSVYDPTGSPVLAVAAYDRFAYLSRDGALDVLDLSDPRHPERVGRVAGGARHLLATPAGRLYAGHGAGLRIFDLAEPSFPVLTASHPGLDAMSLIEIGSAIYIQTSRQGLVAVDIADPRHPRTLPPYKPGDAFLATTPLSPGRLAGLNLMGQVMVIDGSTPRAPRVLGRSVESVTMSSGIRHLAVQQGHRVLVSVAGGVHIFNARDPATIESVGTIETEGDPYGLLTVGETVFVSTSRGVDHYDLSEPHSPRLIDHLAIGGAGLVLDGDVLYVSGTSKLRYDVIDPLAPRLIGTFVFPVRLIDVDGRYAYGHSEENRFQVYDFSEPNRPRLLAETAALPELSRGAVFHQGRWFLGGFTPNRPWDGQVIMVDARDPMQPRLGAQIAVPGLVEHISVADDLVFASSNGLHVLRFQEPKSLHHQVFLPVIGNGAAIVQWPAR